MMKNKVQVQLRKLLIATVVLTIFTMQFFTIFSLLILFFIIDITPDLLIDAFEFLIEHSLLIQITSVGMALFLRKMGCITRKVVIMLVVLSLLAIAISQYILFLSTL